MEDYTRHSYSYLSYSDTFSIDSIYRKRHTTWYNETTPSSRSILYRYMIPESEHCCYNFLLITFQYFVAAVLITTTYFLYNLYLYNLKWKFSGWIMKNLCKEQCPWTLNMLVMLSVSLIVVTNYNKQWIDKIENKP